VVGVPGLADVLRLVGSLRTSAIIGWPSTCAKKRLTLIGPKRSAKATCCSGVRRWSRKKITPWSRKARRISATVSGASGAARSNAADLGADRGRQLFDLDRGVAQPGIPSA
jgi:hypothetical protein